MTLLGAMVLAAMVLTGLTAGFLAAFAHTVMPGLGTADDATYLEGFARIDAAVINGWMMSAFLGGPAVTLVTLVPAFLDTGPARWWVLAASVLSLATIGITRAVHLPLNAEVSRAAPAFVGAAALRQRFEARWVRWNVVRAGTSTAATACLGVALWLA